MRHEHDLLLNQLQQSNADLDVTNNVLNQKQGIIDQESEIARHVFQQLTVNSEHQLGEVRTWMCAVGSFSGDLIQTANGSDGKQYVFLGDFTGHGLPAALGAVPASSVFLAMAQKSLPIESIAFELNDKLYRLLPIGYFGCATLIEIDTHGNRIRIVNAGLPPVIAVNDRGQIVFQTKSMNLPLGIAHSGTQQFISVDGEMKKDYIYSDGITEAENETGEMWGQSGLINLLQLPLEGDGRLDVLRKSLTQCVGNAMVSDDISVLEYRMRDAQLALGRVAVGV